MATRILHIRHPEPGRLDLFAVRRRPPTALVARCEDTLFEPHLPSRIIIIWPGIVEESPSGPELGYHGRLHHAI
jgi:hypothetical protein